jgi:hypothetical protein
MQNGPYFYAEVAQLEIQIEDSKTELATVIGRG